MSGSSVGQIVGGVVGGAIGFVVAGPVGALKGASIGYTLGGVVDPPSGPDLQGPRLDDLRVIASTYGDPIPLVYGPENRVAGNVIWSTGLIEKEKSEDGGKGGGGSSQTTYSYSTSVAVAISGRQCQDIKRIWANGKVIFEIPALSPAVVLPGMDQTNGLFYVKAVDVTPADLEASPPTEEIRIPGVEVNGTFFDFETHAVFTELHIWPGSTTQVPDSLIEGVEGAGNAPAYRGISYIVIKDLQLADFGNRLPNIEVEFEAETEITLGQILHDISTRSGVENASVAGLQDDVRGYAVSKGNGLGASAPLAVAYFLDITEQRGQVRFVKRGRSMKGTLDLAGLGARQSDTAPITPIEYTKLPPVDLPRQSNVVYSDRTLDYQRSTQRAFRDQGEAQNKDTTELPLTLTADQARQIADRLLWLPWTARRGAMVQLPERWIRANPGDLYGVPVAGQTLPYKLVRLVRGDNDILAGEFQQEDLLAYESSAVGASGRLPTNSLELPGITRLFLVDAPIVRDEDDDTGFYWAVTAESTGWRGASVLRSTDDGETFSQMGSIGVRATVGDVSGVVPSGPADLWDRTTTITVSLVFENDVLESRTEDAVLSGANLVWLGDTTGQGGEWLQFATATLISPQTYELTDLLRGRLGTEANIGTHGADEVLVMASQTTGRRDDFGPGDWGVSRLYKPVSILNDRETATDQAFTNDGEGKTPYSPVHITGERDVSDNLTVEWVRRTRLQVPGMGSGPVPLGEATEAYEIDILDGATVVRTLTATSPTVIYTAADQTTDGLTPGDPVDLVVYQMSDVKGRGRPGTATV